MVSGYSKDYIYNLRVSNRMLRKRIVFLEAKLKYVEERLNKERHTKLVFENFTIPKNKKNCKHVFKKYTNGAVLCYKCKKPKK